MRCDSLGNLYVTRWGIGEIWKISPEGRLLKTIKTKGKNTTNVAFGGTDGKTIFVTVADRGIIEYFRVEDPGISHYCNFELEVPSKTRQDVLEVLEYLKPADPISNLYVE